MPYWERLDLQEVYCGAPLNVTSFEVKVDGESIIEIRASGTGGREVHVELKERLDIAAHQDFVNLGKRVQEKVAALSNNQTFEMDRQGNTNTGVNVFLEIDNYGNREKKTVDIRTGSTLHEEKPEAQPSSDHLNVNYNIRESEEEDKSNSNYSYGLQVGGEAEA